MATSQNKVTTTSTSSSVTSILIVSMMGLCALTFLILLGIF